MFFIRLYLRVFFSVCFCFVCCFSAVYFWVELLKIEKMRLVTDEFIQMPTTVEFVVRAWPQPAKSYFIHANLHSLQRWNYVFFFRPNIRLMDLMDCNNLFAILYELIREIYLKIPKDRKKVNSHSIRIVWNSDFTIHHSDHSTQLHESTS